MTTPRLSLSGDLAIEVDGTAGTVRAVDNQVRVDLADPVAAVRAVTGTYGGRPGAAQLASGLAATGVTVEIHGPRGLLSTVGAGVDSRLGGLVVGSRQVSARPAVLAYVPPLLGRRGLVLLAALAAVAALVRLSGQPAMGADRE